MVTKLSEPLDDGVGGEGDAEVVSGATIGSRSILGALLPLRHLRVALGFLVMQPPHALVACFLLRVDDEVGAGLVSHRASIAQKERAQQVRRAQSQD